jgi:TPR repeat protein
MQYIPIVPRSGFSRLALAVAVGTALLAAHQSPAAVSDGEEVAWLQRLADGGDTGAQLQLGLAYRDGRHGLTADPVTALKLLEAAARGGNAYAADAVGNAYAVGAGGAADQRQARRWWLAGAQGGNSDAQAKLGHALLEQGSDAQGLRWLRAAADRGDAQARDELARLYRERPLPDADLHRGENPLDVVAERSNDDVVRLGLGVWHLLQVDDNTAPTTRSLAQQAAAGDPTAEYQLALRYRDGAWGTRRDPRQAQTWLRRAAADGNHLAVQALAASP